MLGNREFKPSKIADEIYGILEDYELGVDQYEEGVIEAIMDYLDNYAKVEFQLGCTDYPGMNAGICYYSWIENGSLHMEAFEYLRV